jgi:phospholipid/cholesterol/gamma-HCH transport system permease protein
MPVRTAEIAVKWLGVETTARLIEIGKFFVYVGDVLKQTFRHPMRTSLVFQQLEFIGNQSLNIILLTGFFTGAVFGLQIGGIFQIFKAEGLMGAATAKALTRELAPLMTGFLISGRVGSSMTAEIATMKVNEQIDAMEAMAVDPVNYLVVPRFIASVTIIPMLCIVFIFIGVIGAYMTGVGIFRVDVGIFIEKMTQIVNSNDIWNGLQKAVVFAVLMCLIACRYGLRASGGAKGVGVATTNSVVVSLLAILCCDVIITYLQVKF